MKTWCPIYLKSTNMATIGGSTSHVTVSVPARDWPFIRHVTLSNKMMKTIVGGSAYHKSHRGDFYFIFFI